MIKQFFKCHENGIDRLQNEQLKRRPACDRNQASKACNNSFWGIPNGSTNSLCYCKCLVAVCVRSAFLSLANGIECHASRISPCRHV